GTLARASGTQSDFGGYLDILLDVAIYALLPIGLAAGRQEPGGAMSLAWLLASFYLNAISWSYLAALLEKRNRGAASSGELTSVTMPAGLIEGAETVVFYALFLIFPASYQPLFWLLGGLVGLTVLQRARWAARALR
ncbi:MAG TPA: CDP-alcohol phosphatidyltransferase family protein, partial [Herpetosiphonaceae bacterium]